MNLNLKKYEYRVILKKDRHFNVARDVLIHKDQLKNWHVIENTRNENLHRTSVHRQIYQLGGLPNHIKQTQYRLGKAGEEISYFFDDQGDVYIQKIDLPSHEKLRIQDGKIYPVRYNYNDFNKDYIWETSHDTVKTLPLNRTIQSIHRIAIGGKDFGLKEVAGKQLIEHIKHAYRLDKRKTDVIGNQYSLIWLDANYDSQHNVGQILDAIFFAATQKANLSWLVHGKCCVTFNNALELLANHAKLGASNQNYNLKNALMKQSVFFSSPRGKVTQDETKLLCKASGMRYVNTHIDPYDWKDLDSQKPLKTSIVST